MLLKYVDSDSTNVTITQVCTVELAHLEGRWTLVFYPTTEPKIIRAISNSFSLCNEYLLKMFNEEKLDISADSNFLVKCESLMKEIDDWLNFLGSEEEED